MFFMQDDLGSRDNHGEQGGGQNSHSNNENQNGHNDNHHNPKRLVCHSKTCEDVKVTVPVEVNATVDVKDIKLECKGHHINERDTQRTTTHRFEIIQEIAAQIPIDVTTEIEIEEERVDFHAHKC